MRRALMRTPSISVLIIFIDLTFVLKIRISKIIPSFFTIKEGFFRIPPSPFSQRELHILTKPSLLRKEGCNRPPVLRTATL